MKRLALCLVLPVAAAVGLAVKAPAAGKAMPEIAPGVRIGSIEVGRLTSEPARARLRATFAQPLVLELRGKRWKVSPERLGAGPSIDEAISRALHARRGQKVPLAVTVDEQALPSYVRWLAKRVYRPGKNARLVGLDGNLAPALAPERPGVAVRQAAMRRRITRMLEEGWRGPLPIEVRPVRAKVTRANYGPIVVIRSGSNRLTLYHGSRPVRAFGVATGSSQYPSPRGLFEIVDKQRHPWWRPPDSDWARGLDPVPPGPGNPLGTRWMGLSAWGVGIHGTPDPASIGYSVSHGCIRMQIWEAEWLFEHVDFGTPVYIVSA